LVFVYWRASCSASDLTRSLACGKLTPGCRRAMARKERSSRLSKGSFAAGTICRCIAIGTQRSGANMTSVPMKPGGAMPITVKGLPLSRISLPTSCGSAAKRRCQNP
jgi:hypothetical protein